MSTNDFTVKNVDILSEGNVANIVFQSVRDQNIIILAGDTGGTRRQNCLSVSEFLGSRRWRAKAI